MTFYGDPMAKMSIDIPDSLLKRLRSVGLEEQLTDICREAITQAIEAKTSTNPDRWQAIRTSRLQFLEEESHIADLVVEYVQQLAWEEVVDIAGNGADGTDAESRFKEWHKANLFETNYDTVRAVWIDLTTEAYQSAASNED